MNIEQAITSYSNIKPNKELISHIDVEYFFEFAETLLTAYEKEKEKNKEFKNQLNTIKDIYYNTNDLEELSDVLGVLLSNLKGE